MTEAGHGEDPDSGQTGENISSLMEQDAVDTMAAVEAGVTSLNTSSSSASLVIDDTKRSPSAFEVCTQRLPVVYDRCGMCDSRGMVAIVRGMGVREGAYAYASGRRTKNGVELTMLW